MGSGECPDAVATAFADDARCGSGKPAGVVIGVVALRWDTGSPARARVDCHNQRGVAAPAAENVKELDLRQTWLVAVAAVFVGGVLSPVVMPAPKAEAMTPLCVAS